LVLLLLLMNVALKDVLLLLRLDPALHIEFDSDGHACLLYEDASHGRPGDRWGEDIDLVKIGGYSLEHGLLKGVKLWSNQDDQHLDGRESRVANVVECDEFGRLEVAAVPDRIRARDASEARCKPAREILATIANVDEVVGGEKVGAAHIEPGFLQREKLGGKILEGRLVGFVKRFGETTQRTNSRRRGETDYGSWAEQRQRELSEHRGLNNLRTDPPDRALLVLGLE
jgi:hypothetical protein